MLGTGEKQKTRQFLKLQYIIFYLALLILVLVSSILDYRSRVRQFVSLIQDQMATTASVVAQSSSSQRYTAQELNIWTEERAFDLLESLEIAEFEHGLDEVQLKRLVPEYSPFEVDIIPDEKLPKNLKGTTHWAASDAPAEILPLSREPLVALKRRAGGALVAHLKEQDNQDLKGLTDIQPILDDLSRAPGVRYVSLAWDESELPIRGGLDAELDSSWERTQLDDILYLLEKQGVSYLEIVRPILLDEGFGEVRIGFDGEAFEELKSQAYRSIFIRTLLISLLVLLTLIWIIARQNNRFLEGEKQRIEAEVRRLEGLNQLNQRQAALGELAAGVAHEIRNPLNAIGIVAQRLGREFEPSTDKTSFKDLTATMIQEIKRINKSLQDFLEYTRPTPLRRGEVPIAELFRRLEGLYASQAAAAGITLNFAKSELSFQGDIEYLQQAFSNLIKNAIEASPGGGRIDLKAKRAGEMIQLEIEDTGSGIAPENIKRIFDLYYSSKDMGTGVGLALTHKIIADHQGTIEVFSEPGKGSRFEIQIPVR